MASCFLCFPLRISFLSPLWSVTLTHTAHQLTFPDIFFLFFCFIAAGLFLIGTGCQVCDWAAMFRKWWRRLLMKAQRWRWCEMSSGPSDVSGPCKLVSCLSSDVMACGWSRTAGAFPTAQSQSQFCSEQFSLSRHRVQLWCLKVQFTQY